QPALGEALGPVGLRADEDRDAVDERAARCQDLLDVPLGRHLRADRQIVHDHIGAGVPEDPHDVGGRALRLLDPGADVLAQAVVGHAAVPTCRAPVVARTASMARRSREERRTTPSPGRYETLTGAGRSRSPVILLPQLEPSTDWSASSCA